MRCCWRRISLRCRSATTRSLLKCSRRSGTPSGLTRKDRRMSEIKDGGPAFPSGLQFVEEGRGIAGNQIGRFLPSTGGMSLRDYFAAKAMQGLIGDAILERHIDGGPAKGMTEMGLMVKRAYQVADAML